MSGKKHFIHECGFAVVDMRDDCDVTDVLHFLYSAFSRRKVTKNDASGKIKPMKMPPCAASTNKFCNFAPNMKKHTERGY